MLYIAYGSNMNLEQMAYRCPNSNVVGNGKLHGWRLVFNVHADIIKTEDKNDVVPVVVWNINSNEDWRRLDMYEGYPSYYVKEIVNVILDDGNEEEAIVYVMADNRKGICPPASGYFNGILKGYIDNGINVDYLFDALDYSCDNETEYNKYKTRVMIE
jgi:gamma-glutamylcyclotransferase (GGCT)/AIG2-like uncharacterized protein YtfP